MLQPIKFVISGLRYACVKRKKKKNATREVHFMVCRFRTRLRRPSLHKPCYDSHICCINLSMQVQNESLNAGRFVVWLLLLYFMRHDKQNISSIVSKYALNNICYTGWKSQCYIDSEGIIDASSNLKNITAGKFFIGVH